MEWKGCGRGAGLCCESLEAWGRDRVGRGRAVGGEGQGLWRWGSGVVVEEGAHAPRWHARRLPRIARGRGSLP